MQTVSPSSLKLCVIERVLLCEGRSGGGSVQSEMKTQRTLLYAPIYVNTSICAGAKKKCVSVRELILSAVRGSVTRLLLQ